MGAANIAAGLFQGFAVSTSGSRTAVAEQSKAKSQVTGVIGAALVAALLLFLNSLLSDPPQTVLAAVVIVAALSLMDLGILRLYLREVRTGGTTLTPIRTRRRFRVSWRIAGRRRCSSPTPAPSGCRSASSCVNASPSGWSCSARRLDELSNPSLTLVGHPQSNPMHQAYVTCRTTKTPRPGPVPARSRVVVSVFARRRKARRLRSGSRRSTRHGARRGERGRWRRVPPA
jgi:hypothetical protein